MEQTERQTQILGALLRLVARGGIEAVSLRTVAQEVGYSLGMVQRQFRSKDDMLKAAVRYSVRQGEERLQPLLLDTSVTARQLLEVVLAQMMDISPETRGETLIWLSFLARAVIEPQFAQHVQRYHRPVQQGIAEIIRHGQLNAEFATQFEAEESAIGLVALADGLTLQLQIGSITPQQASQILARQLEGLAIIT
jgi:TetR/AcrR family transcriptional regulator, transcriptional repressor of bet genes